MSEQVQFDYDPCDEDIFLVGMGSSGKTYLLKHLLVPLYQGAAWIWYPEKREDNLPDYARSLGWQVVNKVDDLPYGRALLYPFNKSEEEFEKFCAKAKTHTNLTIIVDEAHKYVGKFKIRSKSFAEIINAGRPRGNCWVVISRRAQQMHNDILADADHVFCFKMELDGDITFMRKWIGPKVEGFRIEEWGEDSEGFASKESPIPEHGFVYRNIRTGYTAVAKL